MTTPNRIVIGLLKAMGLIVLLVLTLPLWMLFGAALLDGLTRPKTPGSLRTRL